MSDEHEVKQSKSKSGGLSMGKLFWGLLLIAAGSLVLAQNFGLISLNLRDVWQLWPLAIIACGLSVLSVQNIIWRIISLIFTLVAIGLIVWFVTGGAPLSKPSQTNDVSIYKTNDRVTSAKVSINAGASTLTINSLNQTEIVEAKLESDVADLDTSSTFTDGVQSIFVSMNSRLRFWTGSAKSDFNISLSRALPMSLDIDLGATNTNIDVSEVKLGEIDIDAGASSIVVKLGSMMDTTKLSINSGVSSILIKVPRSSGVILEMDSGLVSRELGDLGKVSDGVYKSPNFDFAAKTIEIDAKIGVSSFTIERY